MQQKNGNQVLSASALFRLRRDGDNYREPNQHYLTLAYSTALSKTPKVFRSALLKAMFPFAMREWLP